MPATLVVLPAAVRGLRRRAVLLLWVCALGAMPELLAQDAEQAAVNAAAQMREALAGKPRAARTPREYAQVLTAYQAVYQNYPSSQAAPEAIDEAAGLLAEEGRLFGDERALLNAVGQYELLRQQYPESRYKTGALLHEGEIYWRDLHDASAASTAFEEFLRKYPESQFAGTVRSDLASLRRGGASARKGEADGGAGGRWTPVQPTASGSRRSTVLDAARASRPAAAPDGEAPSARNVPAERTRTGAMTPSAQEQQSAAVSAASTPPERVSTPATAAERATSPVSFSAAHHGRLPLVTGVRHWSTPVYTRVAFDLEDQVQYEAARVPNPDRIYFDLHGARVSSALAGRSIDVTDGGFLKRIRVAQFSDDVTRLVLDVSQVSEYSAFFLPNPWRLIIDVHGSKAGSGTTLERAVREQSPGPGAPGAATGSVSGSVSGSGRETAITGALASGRSASQREIASLGTEPTRIQATHKPTTAPIAASVAGTTRATQPEKPLALAPGAATSSVATRSGDTVTPPPATTATTEVPAAAAIAKKDDTAPALQGKGHRAKTVPEAEDDATPMTPSREAVPTADGQRSLVRALGLKIGRIVVDAGHGGHDSGTLGPEGIEEKQVVLDVALRLGKLLKGRLGADVIYTRDDDTFIPLETRTAIANKAQADLFISVHANSSPDPEARGVETYYLNFTTSPDALEVAARENAVSNQSIHELSDLVKKITLKDKIDESREFAADVNTSLFSGLETGNPGMKDRGVKKAPFVVLIGANMPSILAEISFLTNPNDASELKSPAYRQRIAESLYRGVERYIRGLSGVRLAQAGVRATGE